MESLDTTTLIAIGTAAYALLSEIIGCSKKAQSNSVVQLVMGVLGKLFGRG